jgi:phosphatidate cytidylyltransferase
LLRARITTAAVLVAVVLICVLWLPSWLMALCFALPWTLGAWEWGRFIGVGQPWTSAYPALFLAAALASGGLFDSAGALWIAGVATAWWVAAFVGVTQFPWRIPGIVVAASGLLALLPSWLLLAYLHHIAGRGPTLVLGVLLIVWAADVGAYFCGRSFGRVKLAPAVSPGKTWEGVIGGLTAATATAVAVGAWLAEPLLSWAAIGLGSAMASIVGDLTVSMCKRQAGMKDSSHLLPGHGGVLDRIDSLTAAIPVFFLGLDVARLVG